MRGLFDEHGALRPDQEGALLRHLFPENTPNTDQILNQRRVSLALRILQARSSGDSAGAEPYLAVARRIGLVDANGEITDAAIRSRAETELASVRSRMLEGGVGGSPSPLGPTAPRSLALRLGGMAFASSAPRLTAPG